MKNSENLLIVSIIDSYKNLQKPDPEKSSNSVVFFFVWFLCSLLFMIVLSSVFSIGKEAETLVSVLALCFSLGISAFLTLLLLVYLHPKKRRSMHFRRALKVADLVCKIEKTDDFRKSMYILDENRNLDMYTEECSMIEKPLKIQFKKLYKSKDTDAEGLARYFRDLGHFAEFTPKAYKDFATKFYMEAIESLVVPKETKSKVLG